jgi:hypothetical protein
MAAKPNQSTVQPEAFRLDPQNARVHGEKNIAMIRQALEEVGAFRSIGVDGEGIVRAGNGVYQVAQSLGLAVRVVDAKPDELIAVRRPDLKGEAAIRAALYDNRTSELSEWAPEVLGELAEAGLLAGLSLDEFLAAAAAAAQSGGLSQEAANGTLAARFGVPPFSVLDARQGYWQERKRAWLALGIKSELGRGGESGAQPPHGPTVTRKADGTLDYRPAERENWTKKKPKPHVWPGGGPRPLDRAKQQQKLSPGGAPRPAMKRGADGHTVRGDGRGHPLESIRAQP